MSSVSDFVFSFYFYFRRYYMNCDVRFILGLHCTFVHVTSDQLPAYACDGLINHEWCRCAEWLSHLHWLEKALWISLSDQVYAFHTDNDPPGLTS